MSSPQKEVREDPIAWLLEPDNPSVRYLTLGTYWGVPRMIPRWTRHPPIADREAHRQMDWHNETGRRLE